MLPEIWMYISALVSNWASLIWGTSLIFEVGGLVLRKNQYRAVSDWLDQFVAEETRVSVLRTFLVIGLLIAGFNAWDEQYRTALNNQAANARGSRIYDTVTEQTFLCGDIQGSKAEFCINPDTGAKVPRPTGGYPAHDLSREQMFHLNAGFASAARLFAVGTGKTSEPTCWVTIHAAADNHEFAILVE
jgi:hypothetical protein